MKHVLIADDDTGIVDAIRFAVEDEGYQVSVATDSQVLTIAKQLRPDIILLDIWLCDIAGDEVCRQLKHNPATAKLPIVLMSANKDITAVARSCQADAYLAKPFEIVALLELLGRLTSK